MWILTFVATFEIPEDVDGAVAADMNMIWKKPYTTKLVNHPTDHSLIAGGEKMMI